METFVTRCITKVINSYLIPFLQLNNGRLIVDLISVPDVGMKCPTLTRHFDESLEYCITARILQYISHGDHYFVALPKYKEPQH